MTSTPRISYTYILRGVCNNIHINSIQGEANKPTQLGQKFLFFFRTLIKYKIQHRHSNVTRNTHFRKHKRNKEGIHMVFQWGRQTNNKGSKDNRSSDNSQKQID